MNLIGESTTHDWQSLDDNILHFQTTHAMDCSEMLDCQKISESFGIQVTQQTNHPAICCCTEHYVEVEKGTKKERKKLFRFFIPTFFLLAFRAVN